MHVKILPATVFALAFGSVAAAQDTRSIIVQSTTSTANSGLYDHLLPIFHAATDIQVNVVAVGTGQAIRNAQNCDGDVLLVHAQAAEDAFVATGFGTQRSDLMFNDFVLVGPGDDPAGINGMSDVQDAFAKIAEARALFVSRGDDSGTHKAEIALWAGTGVYPGAASGGWYRETGSGMGATLNTGIGMGAYVMVDRATWISFENKQDFDIQVQGDTDLFNQYGIIPINPEKCPSVDAVSAAAFVDWLLSQTGQDAIAAFRVDDQQLFFPNAPEN